MTDSQRPGADRDDNEPGASQLAFATGQGTVNQAGRDQYILNLGNVLWFAIPTVIVVIAASLYVAVRPASGALSPTGHGSAAPAHGGSSPKSQPLAIALSYDRNNVDNGPPCMGTSWMFRQPISDLPAPPDSNVNETWAHRYGGLDEETTDFKLIVQGLTPTAVDLLGFRIVDVKREPIVKGTDVASGGGCGALEEAGFVVGLGHEPPNVVSAKLPGRPARAIPFPFEVSSTDIQQFQIEAGYTTHSKYGITSNCNCLIEWRLALDWSYEGKTSSSIIDDNGQPFRTMFPSLKSIDKGPIWIDFKGKWSRD